MPSAAVAEKSIARKPASGDLCTADALLAFPRDWHFELVEGRLQEMPPTGDYHGSVSLSLGARITIFVQDNDLGECWGAETGFLVAQNPDTVLAPDFAFIRKDRMAFARSEKFVPVVPDLVLETRSPSDRRGRVEAKVQQWLGAGVRLVLELNFPARTLTVYRTHAEPVPLKANDTFSDADVLPGFTLPLSRLFK